MRSVFVLTLILSAAPVFGAVLTFTDAGSTCTDASSGVGASAVCTNGNFILQSYGDTADLDVTYEDLIDGSSVQHWTTGYGDLTGVVWGGSGNSAGGSNNRIELLPLTGMIVRLNSLDIGSYLSRIDEVDLRILDLVTNAVLADYPNAVIVTGNGHTTFTPNVASANGLAIEWKDSAYDGGMDNIDYSLEASAVPEPSSIMLLATGLGLGLLRLRRK